MLANNQQGKRIWLFAEEDCKCEVTFSSINQAWGGISVHERLSVVKLLLTGNNGGISVVVSEKAKVKNQVKNFYLYGILWL
jgi:hypothetical protein